MKRQKQSAPVTAEEPEERRRKVFRKVQEIARAKTYYTFAVLERGSKQALQFICAVLNGQTETDGRHPDLPGLDQLPNPLFPLPVFMPRGPGNLAVPSDAVEAAFVIDKSEPLRMSRKFQQAQPKLLSLVKLWQESGPNLDTMTRKNPDTWKHVLEVHRISTLTPTTTGWATTSKLALSGVRDGRLSTPEQIAYALFYLLIVNRECERLAGPCKREGCGRYFIKKRKSQTGYCCREHGNAATAVKRTREKLATERQKKLDRVNTAAQKWLKTSMQEDWKAYVSRETNITPKFLTRAANKWKKAHGGQAWSPSMGELTSPKKGQQS